MSEEQTPKTEPKTEAKLIITPRGELILTGKPGVPLFLPSKEERPRSVSEAWNWGM